MKRTYKVTMRAGSSLSTWLPSRICFTVLGPYRLDSDQYKSMPLLSIYVQFPWTLNGMVKIVARYLQFLSCLDNSLVTMSHYLASNCLSLQQCGEQRAHLCA